MDSLTEKQERKRQAMIILAKALGHSTVARRSGVCYQSVAKWADGGITRGSTVRVIENTLEDIALEMSGLIRTILPAIPDRSASPEPVTV